MNEPMTPYLAVFNLHVNDAGKRANKEFIHRWGLTCYNKEITPVRRAGVMSIFDRKPSRRQAAWIRMVTRYVNATKPLK